MLSFNFYLFFTKIVILPGISSTYLIPDHQVQLSWQFLWSFFFLIVFDWLLFSVLSRLDFFFSKREMILPAIQQNELELLELKGIIVL